MTQPFKLLTLMAIQRPWHFHNVLSTTEDQGPKKKKKKEEFLPFYLGSM